VIWNRVVVAAVVVLGVVVVLDAVRSDGPDARTTPGDFRIDLASSRDGTWHPVAMLREAFPGRRPSSLAVSKVAVAPDETVAVGVSHVPGNQPAAAAIQLWNGDRLVTSFGVPAGSFVRGLWFANEGRLLAAIGWDGRGYLYDRSGARVAGTAYFAYETG
jgi:hypothetical protein